MAGPHLGQQLPDQFGAKSTERQPDSSALRRVAFRARRLPSGKPGGPVTDVRRIMDGASHADAGHRVVVSGQAPRRGGWPDGLLSGPVPPLNHSPTPAGRVIRSRPPTPRRRNHRETPVRERDPRIARQLLASRGEAGADAEPFRVDGQRGLAGPRLPGLDRPQQPAAGLRRRARRRRADRLHAPCEREEGRPQRHVRVVRGRLRHERRVPVRRPPRGRRRA